MIRSVQGWLPNTRRRLATSYSVPICRRHLCYSAPDREDAAHLYEVSLDRLSPSLERRFVPLEWGEGTADFAARHPPHGPVAVGLHSLLAHGLSKGDAAALLGMHEMFVLDTHGAAALLGVDVNAADMGRPPLTSLLDVGAGTGTATAALAPLFAEAPTCTEASRYCAWRLARRG